jgi:hypothetical protein
MRSRWGAVGFGLALLGASGCKTISDEARQDLASPVQCATAQEDVARLEAEKVSVAEQIAAGVRTVLPIALVAGAVQRDLGNRARVAIGDYNRDLDAKLLQIRRECGLFEGVLTPEGLLAVENAEVGFAAIRPGVDLARYDELLLLPVAFKFKEGSRELSEAQLDDMRRWFRADFSRQLQEKGSYNLVDHPGPSALLVRAALIDIEVTAPPGQGDDVVIREAGEVTLVAEFRDSQTGELLARAADRRRIEMVGGTPYQSTAVTNIANTRRLFRQWATLLRKRLDRAHELQKTRTDTGE